MNYFLTENKKGYCAHFASSAVLIFRNLGIPSRYVEGYAIDSADIANSTVETENSTLATFKGENPIQNAEMVKVEINDGSAHAWVEIYLDGFGWVPVEVTPASMGYDEEDEDLLSGLAQFFRNAMNGDNVETDSTLPDVDSGKTDRAKRQKNMESTAMKILVPSLLACLVFFLYDPVKSFLKRYRMTHTKDRNKNVAAIFILLTEAARKTEVLSQDIKEHAPNIPFYISLFSRYNLLEEDECISYQKALEQASYSPDVMDETIYQDTMQTSRRLLAKIRHIQKKEARMRLLHLKVKR